MSEEIIEPNAISDKSLNPGISYTINAKIRVKFDRSCLKQEKMPFNHKAILIFLLFMK